MNGKEITACFKNVIKKIDKIKQENRSRSSEYEKTHRADINAINLASRAIFVVAPLDIDISAETKKGWERMFTIRNGQMGYINKYAERARNEMSLESLRAVLSNPAHILLMKQHRKPRITADEFDKFVVILNSLVADWQMKEKEVLSNNVMETDFKFTISHNEEDEDDGGESVCIERNSDIDKMFFQWGTLKFSKEDRLIHSIESGSAGQFQLIELIEAKYDVLMAYLESVDDYLTNMHKDYQVRHEANYSGLNKYKILTEA